MDLTFTLLNSHMHPVSDLTPLVLSGNLVFNNTSSRTRTAILNLKFEDSVLENKALQNKREEKCEEGEERVNRIKSLLSLPSSEGRVQPVVNDMPVACQSRRVTEPQREGSPQGRVGSSDLFATANCLIRIDLSNIPLALLLPTSSTLKQTSSGTVLSLRLSDKYALLDGTLSGTLDSDILVPSGSFIPDVIKSLLAPFDPLLPVFQVNGNNLMSTYDVRIPAGKTVASVIEELSDNMLCTCSYDPSGRLRFRPSDLPGTTLRPSPESTVSFTSSVDYSSIVNDVLVIGATVNGQTFLGRAENNDPSSLTCISRAGRRTRLISMPDYCSDELCAAYARRILRDYLSLSAHETYVISPEAFSRLDFTAVSGFTLSFDQNTPPEVYFS